jgi:hypothetical protein
LSSLSLVSLVWLAKKKRSFQVGTLALAVFLLTLSCALSVLDPQLSTSTALNKPTFEYHPPKLRTSNAIPL